MPSSPSSRRLALPLLAALVIALHAGLLSWLWPMAVPAAPRPVALLGPAAAPLAKVSEAPALPPAPPAIPVEAAPPAQAAPPPARPRPRPAVPLAEPAALSAVPAVSAPPEGLLRVAAIEAPPAEAPAAAAEVRAAPAVPVYAARVPAAAHWSVSLQRGALGGEGELRWAPQADGQYELTLQARIGPLPVLDWRSSGRLDAHGLAPERFVDKRRGRSAQAANFDRAQARITYSGSTEAQPLPPGAQDRLSVLLQLAAVMAADAQHLARTGAQISVWVSGARGDADLWRFTVEGPDTVTLPNAVPVPALRLHREPRGERDLRVQVWLSADGGHLPLRLTMTPVAGGEALDLLLRLE